MVNKNNKKITLEVLNDSLGNLAGMVAKGFENTVTRHDFNEFKSDVNKRLGKLEFQVDEVHDILKCFEENDILNLQKRVQILEKAVRALATNSTSK